MTNTALVQHSGRAIVAANGATDEPHAVSPAEGAAPELGFAQLMGLAEVLVTSGFLPEHIRKPAHAVAVILAGREMGFGPMQSLRSIRLVKGNATVSADLLLAQFKRDGGRAQFRELTEARATLWLRHPNGDEHTETFTLEDARRAGLLGNQNWKNYPKAMLRSRATTAGLKSVGYGPAAGAYDPEEVASFTPTFAVVSGPEGTVAAPPSDAVRDAAPVIDGQPVADSSPRGSLEWAMAYPLPWRKSPKYGEPLGTLSRSELEAAVRWSDEKIREAEQQGQEPNRVPSELKEAAEMVLIEIDAQQATLDLDGPVAATADELAPAALPAPAIPETALAPGRVQDAIGVDPVRDIAGAAAAGPSGDADPTSVYALTRRLRAIVDASKLSTKVKNEIKREILNHANDATWLERQIRDLDGASAPAAAPSMGDKSLPF